MGFKAAESVDPLDYDFSPFADAKGTTPEFTVDRIRDYWNGFNNLLRRHADQLGQWAKRRADLGDLPSAEALADFEREYEVFQKDSADARIDGRRKLLAMLCDNQPDYNVLAQLPGRVFDHFEKAMQDELTPKDSTTAST